jgi:hypothetical protein
MNKTKNGKRTSNNQLCFTIIIMSYFWSELKRLWDTANGQKTLHSMNRTQITKEKYGDTKLLSSSRS